MTKTYFVSFRELEELNLNEDLKQEILKRKNFGVKFSIEERSYIHVQMNGHVHINNKDVKIDEPVKIHSISPNSIFKKINLSEGDLILGFNNLPLLTSFGGEPILKSATGALVPYSE